MDSPSSRGAGGDSCLAGSGSGGAPGESGRCTASLACGGTAPLCLFRLGGRPLGRFVGVALGWAAGDLCSASRVTATCTTSPVEVIALPDVRVASQASRHADERFSVGSHESFQRTRHRTSGPPFAWCFVAAAFPDDRGSVATMDSIELLSDASCRNAKRAADQLRVRNGRNG